MRVSETSAIPFDHLLFFADARNGDQFAFPIVADGVSGKIFIMWNHEDDSHTWVAPSLMIFLERWLQGRLSV